MSIVVSIFTWSFSKYLGGMGALTGIIAAWLGGTNLFTYLIIIHKSFTYHMQNECKGNLRNVAYYPSNTYHCQ